MLGCNAAVGITADWAMFGLARYQQTKKKAFRDLVVAVADAYVDALPAEDVDVWPMSLGHIISAENNLNAAIPANTIDR